MFYRVLVVDPPWMFGDPLKRMKKKTKRSAESNYATMSLDEIKSLDVASVADPSGCVLALWVPSSMLIDGIEVAHSWGFVPKQTFVWVKTKKHHREESDWNNGTRVGMGRLFRTAHEIALVCVSGKKLYSVLKNKSQRSVCFAANQRHSAKPDLLQDRLDTMFPDEPKLELFARRQRVGWTCTGLELDGKDVKEALDELVSL